MLKICLAASVGGHLQELLQLRPVYEKFPHFYILNKKIPLPECMEGRTYFITHSERDYKTALNLWEAWRILNKQRPTHFISTGAGLAVPIALAGKLFGTQSLFIESFCAIYKPTVTGRLMYRIADQFGYQWPYLAESFPNAKFTGPIFGFRNGG